MRTRVPTVVLAAVLLTSAGAFAVANAQSEPDRTATSTETSTSAASSAPSSSKPEPPRTPGPPPWAGQGRGRDDGGEKGTDTDRRGPDHNRGRGPDATGPAAYGLCRAWAEQEDPAAKAERVPPFRNLAAAAGGVDKVDEYCAALPERGDESEEDGD